MKWIWMQNGSLLEVIELSTSHFLQTGGRKVIRLTSLDRSGSANILKNNSYSNLWPFGSIINSAKTRGSQTALPDRRKFLVFVMFAFCLAVSLTAHKQWYHSPCYSIRFGDIHFYCQCTVSSVISYSIWFQKKLVCKCDCKAKEGSCTDQFLLCLLSPLWIIR